MMTKHDLLKELNDSSIGAFEVITTFDRLKTIQISTMDNLISFVLENHIKSVFYRYGYTDAESLVIDEEVFSNMRRNDFDEFYALQDRIEEYNMRVEDLDFSKPVSLQVFCLYQGFIVCYEELDYWFEGEGCDHPEIKLIELETEYLEEIEQYKKDKNEKRRRKIKELKEIIINDKEFQRCSNAPLRHAYMEKLLNDNEEVYSLFKYENGSVIDIYPNIYIDGIWKEYKASLV